MKNKTLFESTLWKELFLVSKMNWQKLNAILQHEQSFPMQCWSEVLEANKSYSVYSGHITMLQSCKPLTIPAHSQSRTLHPSSLVYHYPENLIEKIYCQVCFLLQHLGMNNIQKLIQPYVSSSTEWCPQDRSQFSWALLLVPTETFCCEHII